MKENNVLVINDNHDNSSINLKNNPTNVNNLNRRFSNNSSVGNALSGGATSFLSVSTNQIGKFEALNPLESNLPIFHSDLGATYPSTSANAISATILSQSTASKLTSPEISKLASMNSPDQHHQHTQMQPMLISNDHAQFQVAYSAPSTSHNQLNHAIVNKQSVQSTLTQLNSQVNNQINLPIANSTQQHHHQQQKLNQQPKNSSNTTSLPTQISPLMTTHQLNLNSTAIGEHESVNSASNNSITANSSKIQ
jgi:hypothetical protein